MTNCNFVWFTILLIHLAHLKDFSANIFCLHSNFVKYNRFILLCGKSVWSFDSIVNSPHKKWLQMDNCFINLFFFWDWDAFSSSHFNSKKCFLSKKKNHYLIGKPIIVAPYCANYSLAKVILCLHTLARHSGLKMTNYCTKS